MLKLTVNHNTPFKTKTTLNIGTTNNWNIKDNELDGSQ